MEWFDAFDEVFASVERYVADHGKAPKEVCVSPTLYTWLAELQRESTVLHGLPYGEFVTLDTPYGAIPIAIDEHLGPFEIIPQ
ncbi:MAG: hypothetical protein J5I53_07780 [Bradyrhizobiaceae bacterium]|nr:hypothetical protein [Bradyrhizobiaceae bacterium]